MIRTICIAACLTLPLTALAGSTSWERCRQLGLTSIVDCKRYDEDPVFRAKVRKAAGLPETRYPPSGQPSEPPPRRCVGPGDFNCMKE